MQVTAIETVVVDVGWQLWPFVALRTDAGITREQSARLPR
jgi:hypothetical protein